MGLTQIPKWIRDHYEIHEWGHASAILMGEFHAEWGDLVQVLERFRLLRSSIMTPGGRKSPIAISVNGMFAKRGWKEQGFDVQIVVNGKRRKTPTHGVDYFKHRIAIEMEWNNKDPFYDRDLNNFRLLHQLGVVSVGVIITRASELQEIFDDLGRGASYGQSTTHMKKLVPRIDGGAAGGCPVIAFGIRKVLYDPKG